MKKRNQILALLSILIACLLLTISAAVEGGEVSAKTKTELVFDISKGSVTAGKGGVSGTKREENNATMISWDEVSHYDEIVVIGASTADHYINLDSQCPQDVFLTLRDVSITTAPTSNHAYAPINNLTEGKTLTVQLEGANLLTATSGRVLWVAGGNAGIHFIGRDGRNGKKASLAMKSDASGVPLMVSKDGHTDTSGTFTFENCEVTMNRAFNPATNDAASKNTNVCLAAGATVTDRHDDMYSNECLEPVTLNIMDGDIILNSAPHQVKGHTWILTYAKSADYVITGRSISNCVTVTDPGVSVMLKDLHIVTTGRSAFLVKYNLTDDYEKPLTVGVEGTVSLASNGNVSTFNTNDSEFNGNRAKVMLVGASSAGENPQPKITITRTNDSANSTKAALSADLTAENVIVEIHKNCIFDITAGKGSTVFVEGYIRGDASEKEGGKLLHGSFDYRFIDQDGRAYKPVMQENDMLTLLMPGTTDLSRVGMEFTGGWIVSQGNTPLRSDALLNFAEAGNSALALKLTPSEELRQFGVAEQTVHVRTLKGSENVPAVYLTLTKNTMADVDSDPNQNTKAQGIMEILGADTPSDAAMEIKGRGNASWLTEKKAYQIKLDEKFDVLGMGSAKKWLLLPSYDDNSRTRNAVGFMLAEKLGTDYPCAWEYVDFYADREYMGLYILCEKAEIGNTRINVANIDGALEDMLDAAGVDYLTELDNVVYSNNFSIATLADGTEIDLTGGYHLEFDNNTDPLQFSAGTDLANGGNSIEMISVKEPEALGSNPQTDTPYTYIRNFMNIADAAIYDTKHPDKLRQYVDMESFAKIWLLRDYMLDWDATDNLHIWKESDLTGDGRIHAGPAWDFDNSLGRSDLPDHSAYPDTTDTERIQQSHADQKSVRANFGDWNAKWLAQLLRHPAFQEELARQYEFHREIFSCCDRCNCKWNGRNSEAAINCPGNCGCCIHSFVAEQADLIEDSAAMDMIRWPNRADFVNDVARVQAFACERNRYLETRMTDMGKALYDVTFMNGEERVATIPVGFTGLQDLPVVTKDGYIFKGWFYIADGAEIELTAGGAVSGELTVTAKWI